MDATNRCDETPVPLLDIGRENQPLKSELEAAMAQVADSGAFVLGPAVRELEENVAKTCNVKHAIGCASGSDALLLALMAYRINCGDEVILPSFTFFATASAVYRLGAKPVFVDIEPDTFNICPRQTSRAITSNTKAIIPVHLFGQTVAMDSIGDLAATHGIPVIEDAAQAIGAAYHGRPAGSLGHVACFSFYPTKNLGGFGDGGMLTTDDDDLADRLRLLRGHGMRPRYYHADVGINSRLDSIQAAILNVKLPHLTVWSNKRQAHAERYESLFRQAGLSEQIGLPTVSGGCRHVWNQYTVRIMDGRRDQLRQFLSDGGVGSEIYYPVPMHRQACFQHIPCELLPETELAASQVLSLPIFPGLTSQEQERVVQRIQQFFQTNRMSAPHVSIDVPSSMQANQPT